VSWLAQTHRWHAEGVRLLEARASAVYLASLVAQVAIRLPYERQHRRSRKTDQRISWSERLLLLGLTVGGLILPLLYTFSGRLRFTDYAITNTSRSRAASGGMLLELPALWLFWRAHHDLGGNWSPSLEIAEQQTLVTGGVYARVRHPMYAAQALMALAQVLLLPNWIAGSGGVVMFLAFYFVRVPKEEQMMREHFGEAYTAYVARTGAIVPRLRA
jgi:protein-S-isoprenylcysteine O-methyltransferase Ste14